MKHYKGPQLRVFSLGQEVFSNQIIICVSRILNSSSLLLIKLCHIKTLYNKDN